MTLPEQIDINFFDLLEPTSAIAVLLGSSILCGTFVGFERETKSKPAGMKTMSLVCLGSTVFAAVSHYGSLGAEDHTRLAGQIVTGIGFLGAGAVMHDEFSVKGLTTAATIWATAAIGMVIGFGYPQAGLALSLLVFMILRGTGFLERQFVGQCKFEQVKVYFADESGKTAIRLGSILDEHQIPCPPIERADATGPRGDGLNCVNIIYCNFHKHHRAFLPKVAELENVHIIERSNL